MLYSHAQKTSTLGAVYRFREVYATEEYLVIVMEYASGGHLGERIATNGALSEDKARKLFKMLVDGMSYCHRLAAVHERLTILVPRVHIRPQRRLRCLRNDAPGSDKCLSDAGKALCTAT